MRFAPLITEHESLNTASICKNLARASGGCKEYAPTELGGGGGGVGAQTEKILNIFIILFFIALSKLFND